MTNLTILCFNTAINVLPFFLTYPSETVFLESKTNVRLNFLLLLTYISLIMYPNSEKQINLRSKSQFVLIQSY